MSNLILPDLPGVSWGRARTAQWSTTIKRAASGREYRSPNWSYPVYEYQLDYGVLRQLEGLVECQTLLGFINARRGSHDSFLYRDSWDNTVSAQVIGVGNGVDNSFQLVRSSGGYVEPVSGIAEPVQVFLDGVLQRAGVAVSLEGVATFAVAPGPGVRVSWSGRFCWRVRFTKDRFEFNEMLSGLHELRGLGFTTFKD